MLDLSEELGLLTYLQPDAGSVVGRLQSVEERLTRMEEALDDIRRLKKNKGWLDQFLESPDTGRGAGTADPFG